MKQANCTGTIKSASGLAIGPQTLGALWPVWLARNLKRASDTVLRWRDRARQRRHLSELNDHMLRDIGLTRAAARVEAQKRFWQP